jgi:hypothetical protein
MWALDSSRNSKYGAARAGTVSIVKIFPPKLQLQEPRSEFPVRSSDSSCGKSNSPARPSYAETRKSKNLTRKRTFKSKLTSSVCVGTLDLSIDTKKTKSRETIPFKCLQHRIKALYLLTLFTDSDDSCPDLGVWSILIFYCIVCHPFAKVCLWKILFKIDIFLPGTILFLFFLFFFFCS